MFFLVLHHLDKKERAGCFAFIVFWMSCNCRCSAARLTMPWVDLQFVIVICLDHTLFLLNHGQGVISVRDIEVYLYSVKYCKVHFVLRYVNTKKNLQTDPESAAH